MSYLVHFYPLLIVLREYFSKSYDAVSKTYMMLG